MPSYALNRKMCRIQFERVDRPADTVLLFESAQGADLVGGPGLLADPPRHREQDTLGFVDGRAKSATLAGAMAFVWKPKPLAPAPPRREQKP